MKIREPIEGHQSVVLSVLSCLGLLTKFADICPKGWSKYNIFINHIMSSSLNNHHYFFSVPANVSGADCTAKFLSVVKSTELFGTISLLYASVVPVGKF